MSLKKYKCYKIWRFVAIWATLEQMVTKFLALATWHFVYFWATFQNDPQIDLKPVLNWFKTCLEPVLYLLGTSANIKPKTLTFKNLLKTGSQLVINWFLRMATFLATFRKRLAIFVSIFVAALKNTLLKVNLSALKM